MEIYEMDPSRSILFLRMEFEDFWTHPSIGSTIIAGKRMSNGHNYCNTNLVLLRLGLSEVAQNPHNR
jgi:hypothetical protein